MDDRNFSGFASNYLPLSINARTKRTSWRFGCSQRAAPHGQIEREPDFFFDISQSQRRDMYDNRILRKYENDRENWIKCQWFRHLFICYEYSHRKVNWKQSHSLVIGEICICFVQITQMPHSIWLCVWVIKCVPKTRGHNGTGEIVIWESRSWRLRWSRRAFGKNMFFFVDIKEI